MRVPLAACAAALALLTLTPAAEAQSPRERLRKRLAARRARRAAKAKDAQKKKARRAVHGGKRTTVGEYTFEVVLRDEYVRVYVTKGSAPVSAKHLGGKIMIGVLRRNSGRRRGNHQTSSVRLERVGLSKKHGRLRSYLEGKHKLGKADHQGMRLDVTISGLPRTKQAQTFRVELNGLSPVVTYVCASDHVAAQDPGACPKCAHALKRKVEGRGEGKIGRHPRK